MRTFRSHFHIITLFSALSAALLYTSWYASNLAPTLMERNYQTIKYCSEMQSSLTRLFLKAASGQGFDDLEIEHFQTNLNLEKQNITEENEEEKVAELESHWTQFQNPHLTPRLENFLAVSQSIHQISEINEKSMFRLEHEAKTIGSTVLFGGTLAFALVLTYAIQSLLRERENSL